MIRNHPSIVSLNPPPRHPRKRGWAVFIAILQTRAHNIVTTILRSIRRFFRQAGWLIHLAAAIYLGGLLVTRAFATGSSHPLAINSLTVDGRPLRVSGDDAIRLKPSSENIIFGFSAGTNSDPDAIRLRYRLEGYDSTWHEGFGEMFFLVRFFDAAGDQIAQELYKVHGESPGWNGSLVNSPLTHRRETIVAPPRAARVFLAFSSGGPPQTIGIYLVANLRIIKSTGQLATEILRSPFDRPLTPALANDPPQGWMPDGIRTSMAKIVDFGQHPQMKAFAIIDEDPVSHAEWHIIKEQSPSVSPGDNLVIEWDEMYSMGEGARSEANYVNLPPGNFKFEVQGLNIMGVPTGVSASLPVVVPQKFWKTLWFWSLAIAVFAAIMIATGRYFVRQRMEREMARLRQQRALEQERLRIAHDIHDDLGARVTQISLVSAMAQDNGAFPEKARADFDKISRMSRELVSALYETVWAVNPENDNLDALGNYLCQMVRQLCEHTPLRCRFHVQNLPAEVQVSSQTRHNISMAVKEAVHNIIKHARATELTMRMEFKEDFLTVSVRDDGCGFQPRESLNGHGLTNMRQRIEKIGGLCTVESGPGAGTTVYMRLTLNVPVPKP